MIQVLITVDDAGAMNVKYTGTTPITALGIMEMAKMSIERSMREPAQQTPEIIQARLVPKLNGN